MRYFDRKGTAISRDRWRELFDDQSYGLVEHSRHGNMSVDTSWVGVASDHERSPAIFLTRTYTGSMAKGGIVTKQDDIWSDTESRALEAHLTACDAVGLRQDTA